MNLEDFRKRVIEPLMAYSPAVNRFRIEFAYRDLINTFTGIQEYLSETNQFDFIELAISGNQKLAKQLSEKEFCKLTLLKSLFIFSDIFVSVLLSEVIGSPGLTFNQFLRNPKHPLDKLSMNQLLSTYCIIIYRNKLIAHHDVNRDHSGKFGKDINSVRLLTFPEKMNINDKDYGAVIRLRDKYAPSISEIAGEINYYSLLKKLYYSIPIGSYRHINNDRNEINKLAEQGGCESLTPFEIMEVMDQFALAIISVLVISNV